MTLRYKLRTLLILLAVLPPLLWIGWTRYEAWREAERQRAARERLQQELLLEYQKELTALRFVPPPQPMLPPAKALEVTRE